MKFSFVVITFNRDDVLEEQFSVISRVIGGRDDVEVILVDNNEDNVDRAIYLRGLPNSFVVKLCENRGVSGGRNAGIEKAQGEYLIFIDDDAIFESPEEVLSKFESIVADSGVAAIAIKSINYFSGEMAPHEFPHADKTRMKEEEFETYQFIGVGHCVSAGWLGEFRYDESYFYSMEEFDLSFFLINKGGTIRYTNSIVVRHKVDPRGRVGNVEKIARQLSNKMKNNYKYYPFMLRILSSGLWSLHAARKARSVRVLVYAWKDYFGWVSGAKRNQLTRDAKKYLKKTRASLIK